MSDQDLSLPDDEPAEDPPFEEPAEAPEPGEEDPVADQAEESSEAAEGASDESPEADDDDPEPSRLLESIPEEHRKIAEQYGKARVAGLQRSLTPKLEEAARLREKAALPDRFEEQLQTNPAAVLDALRNYASQRGWLTNGNEGPPAPQDPGEMPDPAEDTAAFKEWYQQSRAWDQHLLEQKLAQERQKLKPMEEIVRQRNQDLARKQLQVTLEAKDDEMAAIDAMAAEIQKDPTAAGRALLELHRLKKSVQGRTREQKKAVAQAVRGQEERPGLPRTGARKPPPKPTGSLVRDIIAELEHEGIAFEE